MKNIVFIFILLFFVLSLTSCDAYLAFEEWRTEMFIKYFIITTVIGLIYIFLRSKD
jgi:hypothetical protein